MKRLRVRALYRIRTVIHHVLSNLYHHFLATLYLSRLSLVNCLALVHVPASNALYEKHFPKMYEDVGMAVPKTTQTRYMDGIVQAT